MDLDQPPRPVRFELPDRDVFAWDFGGDGPRVLALHGFLDTGRSYDAIAGLLRGKARVMAVDWRGHGQARPIAKGASAHLLDHLKDLSGLLDRLTEDGTPPDLVVAHSMGGNVALLLAGTRPELVQRLVLLDALGGIPEDGADQVDRLSRLLRYPQPKRPFKVVNSVEAGVARVRQTAPHLTEEGANRMLANNLEANSDGTFTFAFDPQLRGPTPLRWPESFWLALCANVKAPTVMVRAEHGFIPDEALTRTRLKTIPNAKWVDAPNTGHHLHVDCPQLVADTVLAMLAEQT